jgi:predicted ribosomally synthesized peptide with SipW-like signal peptide
MRNVLLSIVVVATLLGGGLTGTFAHFSDTEEVFDNYVAAGSLDLTVSDFQGIEYQQLPWGEGIPALFVMDDAVPGKDVSMHFDLHNAGQVAKGTPYIHFKNVRCEDIVPNKFPIWVLDGEKVPEGTPGAVAKTEPEAVAEFGGYVGQVLVPGIGDIECFLSRWVEIERIVVTEEDGDEWTVPLDAYDTDPLSPGVIKLSELVCHNIPLLPMVPTDGVLNYIAPCTKIFVDIDFLLEDIDEDALIAGGLLAEPNDPPIGDGGYFDGTDPDIALKCWDKWPTNALQKDKLYWDMLFSLTQYDP